MQFTGRQFLDAVAKRLDEENIRCYDTAIVKKIQTLSSGELNQLVSFGDVTQWHNDRIEKQHRLTDVD